VEGRSEIARRRRAVRTLSQRWGVLRATKDLRVWRVLLLGLLIADFGHIYSVHAIGSGVYYRFWEWNSMYWGNLGFVYIGAAMRAAFLLGLGLSKPGSRKVKA